MVSFIEQRLAVSTDLDDIIDELLLNRRMALAGTARATVLSLPGSPAFLRTPSYVQMRTTVKHHVAGTRSLKSWYLLHIVETKQNQQGEKVTKYKDGAGDASSSFKNMYSLKSNVMKTHVQEQGLGHDDRIPVPLSMSTANRVGRPLIQLSRPKVANLTPQSPWSLVSAPGGEYSLLSRLVELFYELLSQAGLYIYPTWLGQGEEAMWNKNVTQMLPGGLNVLGFFFIGSVDVFEDREFPLNKLLMDFRNELSCKPIMYGGDPASEILVYFKNSQTGKPISQQTATALSGRYGVLWSGILDSQELAPATAGLHLSNILPLVHYTHLHLTTPLILGTACLSETVVARCVVLNSFPLDRLLKSRPCRHEKVFMTSLYKSIANVTFLFDEQKKDGSFPIKDLQVPAKKKEYKYQQKPSNSAREYTATIILHEDNEQEGLKIVSAEAELWFKGSVVSQVIIHSDAVVKEAEEASGWAVKSDILRTLSRRLDMHWHSLVEEDINSFEGEKMVHEPPRRVLFPLCDNSITFSDHLFPGEDVEENVDLINSTFNVHLDIADVQEDLEQHDKTRALKVVRSPNRYHIIPVLLYRWKTHY
uniref:Uncharacterized protein n=1 Tax=Timema poppense TaxID=170557 RepID=A0A7R9CQX0_TIMPO|nr:unnamed protein product [Timema poppensis]